MRLAGVPADYISFLWPEVSVLLASVPQEEYGLEDIRKLLEKRDAQLWVILTEEHELKGCLVTEILTYPRLTTLRVMFGAGEQAKEWMPLVRDVVIPWARAHHCTAIEVDGRLGWERLVTDCVPNARRRCVLIRGAI